MQGLPSKTLHRRLLSACMHRLYFCKPGSLARDGPLMGRFVELKESGLEGDLVTYNTLLKACMRSANLPCARVIMTWIRERGLQVSLLPGVFRSLGTLLRTELGIADLAPSREACSVQSVDPQPADREGLRVCTQPPLQWS